MELRNRDGDEEEYEQVLCQRCRDRYRLEHEKLTWRNLFTYVSCVAATDVRPG